MRSLSLVLVVGCRFGFEAVPSSDGTNDAFDDDASDGSTEVACNPMSRIGDTFDGAAIDQNKWGDSYMNAGTSMGIVGGELVLTPASNQALQYTGLKASRAYDLRGQRWIAEVSQLALAGAATASQLEWGMAALSVSHLDGSLRASHRTESGTYVGVDEVPYSAALHRFWGISEQSGTIFYETSTDGISFTAFASVGTPFDISLVRPTVYSGTSGAVASPGEAHYPSVGPVGTRAGAACAATTFSDTFAGTSLGGAWEIIEDDGCCSFAVADELRLSTTGMSLGFVTLRGLPGLDLRGSEVVVELVQGPTVAGVVASLSLRNNTPDVLDLQVTSTTTNARITISGGTPMNLIENRDPAERFLRISEAAGDVIFSVSMDGTAWRTLRSLPAPFPVDDLAVQLRENTTSLTSAATIVFDNLNVP